MCTSAKASPNKLEEPMERKDEQMESLSWDYPQQRTAYRKRIYT